MPTDRLYYHDSFLFEFDAQVVAAFAHEGRNAIVLDRTAFYPTSGGQVHDTGKLVASGAEVWVTEVADDDEGRVLHFISTPLAVGTIVHGSIASERRIDHIQQHTGQHVLSAAFIELFNMPTVSFHMGEESCTIDIQAASLTQEQAQRAERLSNRVVAEDRPVKVRFVSLEEAQGLGLRKLPPKQMGELRLIDITDFDLTACGGTHVRATGQIGSILLRKVEKVKQGVRVEFVCGLRAVDTARRDYTTLTEAATAFSSHIHDVPEQVRKLQAESKSTAKAQQKVLEELAGLYAERMLAQAGTGQQVVTRVFPDRDAVFIKLLAQKLTATDKQVIALLASAAGQPALVFAQTRGGSHNMGQLLKATLEQLGGRGGGNADMAQGGLPGDTGPTAKLEEVLAKIAKTFP